MSISIISAINSTLNNAKTLLDSLDDEIYIDKSVGPFYSSVGSHLRHLLDFFNCVVEGVSINEIDLTLRKRNETIANNRSIAREEIERVLQRINNLSDDDFSKDILVYDDCGTGKIGISYSLEGILAQGNSHAIHHFAIISFLLFQLDVRHEIKGFGYNPTTPIPKRVGA